MFKIGGVHAKKLKWIKILWIIPLLIPLLLIVSPIINTITAYNVAQEIWETPVPPDTEQVEKISKAGKLNGSGNGMQFLGVVLLKSECSLEELKTHYSNYSQSEWEFIVSEQTTNKIMMIEHENTTFNSSLKNGNYYIVYSWGDGISPFCELDLRGH